LLGNCLRKAIDNYPLAKELLREWEEETERIIDAEKPQRS
jgi:hypothetical protein